MINTWVVEEHGATVTYTTTGTVLVRQVTAPVPLPLTPEHHLHAVAAEHLALAREAKRTTTRLWDLLQWIGPVPLPIHCAACAGLGAMNGVNHDYGHGDGAPYASTCTYVTTCDECDGTGRQPSVPEPVRVVGQLVGRNLFIEVFGFFGRYWLTDTIELARIDLPCPALYMRLEAGDKEGLVAGLDKNTVTGPVRAFPRGRGPRRSPLRRAVETE